MTEKSRKDQNGDAAAVDPYASSSLLPMLVSGLLLIVVGMVFAAVLS